MMLLRVAPLIFLALAAFTLSGVAQQPPPPPRVPSGSVAPGNVAPAQQEMVRLQFPNSDVQDVLRLYETLTGKKVITDNTVQGKVNIFLSKDVPRDEAISIIEMNLLMNGFALVPAEHDIVKVVGNGKNPRNAGIPILSDESQIPAGEQVISYLFKLHYADPSELVSVLQQYDPPGQTNQYVSFLPLPKSSAILVTENSSMVRGLARIIEQIDVPPAEVVSEFIPLQRADASKVVDLLKDIFEKGNQQTSSGAALPGGVRNVRGVPNIPQPIPQAPLDIEGSALSGLTEDAVVVGKVRLSADVRTNRIHVITRPENLPIIRKLIAEFDANVQFAKPVTRPLRYISAGDVLPILVQALTEPGTNEQGGTAAGGTNPNSSAQEQQQQRRNNSTVTSPNTAGQTSTASDSNLNISEELSTQPVDTAPKSATVGNTKLIADLRANTIITLGTTEVVMKVNKILDQMDVKAPQVTLSTVIGELTLNNDEEFGVDYLLHFKHVGGGAGGAGGVARNSPLATGVPLVNPSSLSTVTKLAAVATGGTNIYVAAGNTLAAIVHALDSTGRLKIISRPTVFTTNNKKAIIASGQEVPVPVNTISSATGSGIINTGLAQQSNIEYKKVALQLEVVPLINSEKEVSLDILQKIDSLGDSNKIDNNNIPTINTRYIRTNVSAPNCSTIILGGLIQDNKSRNTSGIPFLDRLPGVGPLFRFTTKNTSRTELIILMRPEVSLTKLDLYRLREKNEGRTHFGPELEQDDCPDCPKGSDGKAILPAPDVPSAKDFSSR